MTILNYDAFEEVVLRVAERRREFEVARLNLGNAKHAFTLAQRAERDSGDSLQEAENELKEAQWKLIEPIMNGTTEVPL